MVAIGHFYAEQERREFWVKDFSERPRTVLNQRYPGNLDMRYTLAHLNFVMGLRTSRSPSVAFRPHGIQVQVGER